jgi:O-acetyl-ADP-ribose deacetylase
MTVISIQVGRIETLAVDAVVNAANTHLAAGSGVDGAIRAAAGGELNRLLAHAGRLDEGAALATPGFQLPAPWIIHTVAPVWRAPGPERDKVGRLAQCYRSCLEAAADLGLASIAFPALGTGAFGWPKPLAAETAVGAVLHVAPRFRTLHRVVFCCFTDDDAAFYRPLVPD